MPKLLIMLALLILTGAGCQFNRLKIKPSGINGPTLNSTSIPALPQGQITIFVGQGCQHCAAVESRVKNGRVDRKLPIVFKEISNNQNNAAQMIQIARQCGLVPDNLSAPLLWDGKNCYGGDTKILKYIEERTNVR